MLTDVGIPESSTIPNIEVILNTPILTWLAFSIAILGIAIYGGIIVYHWFRYDSNAPLIWPTMLAYLSVSFLLIFITFFAAVSIT